MSPARPSIWMAAPPCSSRRRLRHLQRHPHGAPATETSFAGTREARKPVTSAARKCRSRGARSAPRKMGAEVRERIFLSRRTWPRESSSPSVKEIPRSPRGVDTIRAAAAWPEAMASSIAAGAAKRTESAPMNTSPAPCTETTGTGRTAWCRTPPPAVAMDEVVVPERDDRLSGDAGAYPFRRFERLTHRVQILEMNGESFRLNRNISPMFVARASRSCEAECRGSAENL